MLNNILIYIMICYKNMALLMQTSFLVVIAQKNLQSNYVKSSYQAKRFCQLSFSSIILTSFIWVLIYIWCKTYILDW